MWTAPAISFLISVALLAILLRWSQLLPQDRPNERSLHSGLVPRAGGLALVPAVLVGWTFTSAYPWLIGTSMAVLAAASYIDDRRGLPVSIRLVLHLAAALVFVAAIAANTPWLLLVAMVLTITWAINLYNFMDGADGLAGGMALFGFSAYAAVAWQAGASEFAMVNLCVATAALGFLIFNYPPARVFLGDAGSVPLGYLAAALGISGAFMEIWPWWFPPLVFSPFAVDASVTLIKRLTRGERVWEAHRDHYYQRLIRSGWSHRKVARSQYVLMALVCVTAAVASAAPAPVQIGLIVIWVLVYTILMWLVDRHWRAVQPLPRPAQ